MKTGEPRKIIAQPYDFSVQDLVNKIKEGDIDLQPNYQRNYVWASNDGTENKRSRLIESLLLNIPIPVIYFAEAETLTYEVIDGQQRLKTFQDFIDDKFPLTELEMRSDVNGKLYSQLAQKDRDLIRKRSIRAIVILNESDEQIKYEVFERLNLGSIQLTPQEIRNNMYRGKFNDLLKELANETIFKSLVKLNLKKEKNNMSHEELVLRFFAYHASNGKRAKELELFLTNYMQEKMSMNDTEISEFRELFLETICKVNKYLGDKAFSTLRKKGQEWSITSNRLMYEAEMLAFALVSEDKINVTKEEFQEELRKLLEVGSDFKKSLSSSGGFKVEERVHAIKNILLGSK